LAIIFNIDFGCLKDMPLLKRFAIALVNCPHNYIPIFWLFDGISGYLSIFNRMSIFFKIRYTIPQDF
jgi:hypothetical protein